MIFQEFLGERRLLATYLAGGIAGALLFILAFTFIPSLATLQPVALALGASAAIMAILIAAATYLPNYSVNLMLIGSIKLKYIAIFYIVIDILSIPQSDAGGHIAHIGGALYGFLYIKQMQQGKDWANFFSNFFQKISNIFKPKSTLKVKYKKPKASKQKQAPKEDNQARINAILDKISKTGYDSLTKSEKDELFRAGQE